MLVNGKEVGHLILNGETFDKSYTEKKLELYEGTKLYTISRTYMNGVDQGLDLDQCGISPSIQICSVIEVLENHLYPKSRPSLQKYLVLDKVDVKQGGGIETCIGYVRVIVNNHDFKILN